MNTRAALPTAMALILGAMVLAPVTLARPAAAQGGMPVLKNVVPEAAAVSIRAKITAIDQNSRRVTLTGQSGQQVTVTAGPGVRLEMLKVGDTVDAQYYRSVAFLVSPPGAPAPQNEVEQVIARPVEAPGGVAMQATQISGLVVAIDLAHHTIQVVNPQGGEVVMIDVTDPARQAMLPSLKVGDTITAVVSQALAVSLQPPAK